MANDRDPRDLSSKGTGDKQSDVPDNKRKIGEGMDSLDSTQVPLKAETGEPDWDAINGDIPSDVERKRPDRKASDR